MKKHIFLTGEKQVGKSTLIRKYLEDYKGLVGGFLTVKTNKVYEGQYSVHLVRPSDDQPNPDNLLFFCTEPRTDAVSQRFNNHGCAALKNLSDFHLILMDELGLAEANAAAFQKAVLTALDQNVPILGVIQKADSAFLDQITWHPDVDVIEVTLENRNSLLLKGNVRRT